MKRLLRLQLFTILLLLNTFQINPEVLERLNRLEQYHEKRTSFYWIRSYIGIRDNENADTAAKSILLRRVTNIPIPYGDSKKHINHFLKDKWQPSLGQEQLL